LLADLWVAGHGGRRRRAQQLERRRSLGLFRRDLLQRRGSPASQALADPVARCRPRGALILGDEKKLDLAVRLGWQHEFADTGRPITAAFAGAPGNSFTVFGATPARDAAIVGLQATTTVAEATQVYLRYDGGVGGGTDNHALNVGVRFSW
jgi:hypothetical protein